jgi:MFS family permease
LSGGPDRRVVLFMGGFVFSVPAAAVCATLMPWGTLTDRIGERPAMAGGLIALAAVLALTAFAPPALLIRGAPPPPAAAPPPEVERPTLGPRPWRLGAAPDLLVAGQAALPCAAVLFRHDQRGIAAAALGPLFALLPVVRLHHDEARRARRRAARLAHATAAA